VPCAAYIGGCRRGGGKAATPPPPNLAPIKFQERPSGASSIQETLLAAADLLRTSLGELIALPSPLACGEEADCPLFKNPIPAVAPFDLGLRPIASPLPRNRRFGPSQHDGLDPPMAA